MKNGNDRSKTAGRRAARVIIGREAFAKISAVEGVALSPAMQRRVVDFDRRGLPAEARRRAIISAHRKG